MHVYARQGFGRILRWPNSVLEETWSNYGGKARVHMCGYRYSPLQASSSSLLNQVMSATVRTCTHLSLWVVLITIKKGLKTKQPTN